MTLSVVIPALNEAERIAAAVVSARAPGVEVVVVDGGSGDATRERAAAAGARVVTARAGRACQMAVGADQALGDVILFLHADTRLPAGFASAIFACLADPRTVGGAFRFRFDRGGVALRLIEWGAWLRVALFRMPYGDQGLFIRRRTLDQIGGVPQVPIMEDMDLVRAMKSLGRVASLALPATTSARRYLEAGVFRTMARNWIAATGWLFGVDRQRVAAWYRR